MPGPAVAGDDQYPAAGQLGPQRCGDLHTVGAGHLQIEDGDIGLVRPCHRQRLGLGRRLGHDHEVVLQREQRGERAPDEVLVVGEQQSYGSGHAVTSLT